MIKVRGSIFCVNKVVKVLTDGKNVSTYYKNDPIEVMAPAVEGYRFDGWEVTGGEVEDAKAEVAQETGEGKNLVCEGRYKEYKSED